MMSPTARSTVKPLLPEGSEPDIGVQRILWASDFSSRSASALRFVIPLARAYGSGITAVHVMEAAEQPASRAASLDSPAPMRPHLRHEAAASLDCAVRPATAADVPTQIALREGKAVDEILGLARSLPADLIALGKSAPSSFDWSRPGPVVEGILASARCPVLVVPDGASLPLGWDFKTVLWATDCSHRMPLAQRYAFSLARKSDARLVVLHALEGDVAGEGDERTRRAEERLAEVVTAGRAAGCEIEAVLTKGDAAREVGRIARERQVELIVIGLRGARPFERLLFGSTALRVVQDAPCAVLAVRNP